jgi:hypothetical protein
MDASSFGCAGDAQFVATSGGPHSPATWARFSAAQIIQIDNQANDERVRRGRELQREIIRILEAAHASLQQEERNLLAEFGMKRLGDTIDPRDYIIGAIISINHAANALGFRYHFEQPHVQDNLRYTLGTHFATSIDIERKWWALKSAGFDAHPLG